MQRRFYRIRVAGTLGDRFRDSFGFMQMEPDRGGTVLSGVCVDASALFGVLDQIRDLGLELLEVESFTVAPAGGVRPGECHGTPR
jgi:hypothetical protein